MPANAIEQQLFIGRGRGVFQIDGSFIAAVIAKFARFIKHISESARHARGEVASGFTQDDDQTIGHVFAAMVAQAFDDSGCTGIAHGKPLACHPIEECLAAGGPVEDYVANQNVLRSHKRRCFRGVNEDTAAGKTLTDVIVGVTFEFKRDTTGEKSTKALAGGSGEFEFNGVVRQARGTMCTRDFARKHGTHGAVDIADGQFDFNRSAIGRVSRNGITGMIDEFEIERFVEAMILFGGAAAADARRQRGVVEDCGEVESSCFPVFHGVAGFKHVGTTHHFVYFAEAELRHNGAHLFGNKEEEIDDVFRLTGELGAQGRVLRGDSHGTGVEVALAHHDAAEGHQRHGGKAEFFRTQQRGNGDIAAGLQFAVRLNPDAAAQVIHYQNLLGFGEAQFPGRARVFQRGQRGCPGAAVMSTDENHVGMGFGNTRRDGSYA